MDPNTLLIAQDVDGSELSEYIDSSADGKCNKSSTLHAIKKCEDKNIVLQHDHKFTNCHGNAEINKRNLNYCEHTQEVKICLSNDDTMKYPNDEKETLQVGNLKRKTSVNHIKNYDNNVYGINNEIYERYMTRQLSWSSLALVTPKQKLSGTSFKQLVSECEMTDPTHKNSQSNINKAIDTAGDTSSGWNSPSIPPPLKDVTKSSVIRSTDVTSFPSSPTCSTFSTSTNKERDVFKAVLLCPVCLELCADLTTFQTHCQTHIRRVFACKPCDGAFD